LQILTRSHFQFVSPYSTKKLEDFFVSVFLRNFNKRFGNDPAEKLVGFSSRNFENSSNYKILNRDFGGGWHVFEF
jgi:hypothetical protein